MCRARPFPVACTVRMVGMRGGIAVARSTLRMARRAVSWRPGKINRKRKREKKDNVLFVFLSCNKTLRLFGVLLSFLILKEGDRFR